MPYNVDTVLERMRWHASQLLILHDSDDWDRTAKIVALSERLASDFAGLDRELSQGGNYPQDWAYNPERDGYLPGPSAPEPF